MDPNEIAKRRQTLIKTGVNFEDLRRRRNEQTVELRKNKREDILCKKRSQRSDGLDDDSDNFDGIDVIDFTQISDEHLNKVLANVYHFEQNHQLCHSGVKTIRKYLSQDNNPPIDRLLDFGVLNPLVRCLTMDEAPNIQFEAAWAITNIASGTSEQTHKVVTSGAPSQLRRLIYSKVSKIAEQSFWAFGNIVGDGPYLRDYIVKMDIVKCILEFVCGPLELTFLRNITWVVVNLCRYKDPPLEFREFQRLVPALVKLLTYEDRSVLIDSLWAISYATDCGTEYVNEVIRSGMIAQIVPNLSHAETAIQTASLRALGNIVTGTDEQTQAVLDCNVLSHFTFLLSHEKARIRKEAVWFISNIAAGSALQIQKLIDANILPLVAENLRQGDFTIKKEAIWAISNLTINGTRDHIAALISLGVLPQFCDFLQYHDAQLIQIILEGILNMLRVDDINMHKNLITMVEECGGLDRIENLQSHENSDIYKMAYNIIESYFSDNAEDSNLAPDSTEDGYIFYQSGQQEDFDFSNL